MKIVTITIDENGDPSVDLAGYKGKGCHAVQEAFAALGTLVKDVKKTEYNQPMTTTNLRTQGR